MKKEFRFLICALAIGCMALTCKKQSSVNTITPLADTSLVNLSHLDYLYTPVTFPNGTHAAGVYIYSDAPDYHLVDATGEGFTCVDDVARAILVYIRDTKFSTDTSIQNKTYNLITFVIEMQSSNGYFYNFLQPGNTINMFGTTSVNTAQWWSWRALQALTEAYPVLKTMNPSLAAKVNQSVNNLVTELKTDQVNIPQTTTVVDGITIPQWLPAGSATDQAAIMVLGLIPYCTATNDAVMTAYVKKLADGIALMEQGDSAHFPYSCILSWQNTWNAYGSDQAYALFKAGLFLNDTSYTAKGKAYVDNFLSWILQNGMQSSFVISATSGQAQLTSELTYSQIAYGTNPMVFAAAEAYHETGQAKYADMAGHLAAWFLGNNVTGMDMYVSSNGIGYDGISSSTSINMNSGAESTIESLMTMEEVESYPAILAALNKYKK
jgi:hypothetical protein